MPWVRPEPSFNSKARQLLGWSQSELSPTLEQADLMPHGAGVCFPGLTDARLEDPVKGIFSARGADGKIVRFTSPRQLPFEYRGLEVLERVEELQAGRTLGWLKVVWWTGGAKT